MNSFSYQQAEDYLNDIIRAGIKYDLNNIRSLLRLLDYPHKAFPHICIAGTNGKGSTAAFLESMLAEAGYKAGLNTSPHLATPRERLRINRVISSHEDFAAAIGAVAGATRQFWREDDPFRPTFFETMTTASLVYFRAEKVDIAIMEAGLGGRLDGTNALDPLATIITRIGLDHPKTLGNTLKKIAFEKFGLARVGRPLIVARQRPHVMKHLRDLAHFRGALISSPEGRWTSKNGIQRLETSLGAYSFNRFGIPGSYQRENVAVAVAAAEMLRKNGFDIDNRSIEKGVEKAYWPGRMELKEGEPRVLLDGSHNSEGISHLVKAIGRLKASRKTLIYAKVGERSPRQTARKLFPLFDKIYLPPLEVGRAVKPEELLTQIGEFNPPIETCTSLHSAWEKAQSEYRPGDLIVVAGSLYLVGAFKALTGDTMPEA